jgi:hypothetical protein
MTSPTITPAEAPAADNTLLKVETAVSMDQKPVPRVEKVDYSGAHEKTDPKEIALVKKLDRWIMVCPAASTIPRPAPSP